MIPSTSRLPKIALVCLISGTIAGLLVATQCGRAETDCRIAALQSLSSDPAPWTLWLHWINWLPGLVFGLLLSTFGLRSDRPDRIRRIALYALASAGINVLAELVFSLFLLISSGDEFAFIVWAWPAGFSAGLTGAILLALSSGQLLPVEEAASAFRRSWVPAIIGGVAGVGFVFTATYFEQQVFLAFPAAFCLWQVSVGLALGREALHTRPITRRAA